MIEIKLKRFCYGVQGVFGLLSIEHKFDFFQCYTVERPWRDNEPFVSCIPDGRYIVEHMEGLKKPGAEWQLVHVPQRTAIEFHVANTIDDLAGCIGLGSALGFVSGKWAVTNSTTATAGFNDFLDGEKQALLIIEAGKL